VPVHPDPTWQQLLEAAKATPNDAAAWRAFHAAATRAARNLT
jgi:hypothetical protein